MSKGGIPGCVGGGETHFCDYRWNVWKYQLSCPLFGSLAWG